MQQSMACVQQVPAGHLFTLQRKTACMKDFTRRVPKPIAVMAYINVGSQLPTAVCGTTGNCRGMQVKRTPTACCSPPLSASRLCMESKHSPCLPYILCNHLCTRLSVLTPSLGKYTIVCAQTLHGELGVLTPSLGFNSQQAACASTS
jgi:hypothetical protein